MKAVVGRNNVKVYNLSAGKSLPDWLTDRKRRQLSKRDVDFRRKIELIQDFDMPDISNCVQATPDGQFIVATGTYKPLVKCYDVSALSVKFERCFDADVVQFAILSDDYTKMVFLQEERYIEFHSKAGRWFRTRIPKFGRDLACHYPSCDLYIAASGSEIYRLNMSQGRFLNPIKTDGPGVNKCLFNPVHYLFTCGMEDGRVEAWDPRSRQRVGVLDCAMYMNTDNLPMHNLSSVKKLGVTALASDGALTLGVGTRTGQVLLYDIRSDKPMVVKDHMEGFPIKALQFHNSSGKVLSMSTKQVKIWEKNTGETHTSIESGVDYNDMCVLPESGMIFLATEDTKMQTYFLPSLGPAPRWCSHLDALIEELEEEDIPTQYDDYKFVTTEELSQLGLDNLIGTNMLRAAMHGFYMDVRLYNKAKLIANPFNYEDFKKRKVKQKISEQNKRSIQTKKLPPVNKELFEKLLEEEQEGKPAVKASAKKHLKDERFGDLFKSDVFQIDQESDSFKRVNPVVSRIDKKKAKQMRRDEQEELDDLSKLQTEAYSSSDSDSDIMSSEEEKHIASPIYKKDKLKKDNKLMAQKNKIETDNDKDVVVTTDKEVAFTSGDSIDELKKNSKKLAKMSLADRLQNEDDTETVKQHSFGSREMAYVVDRAPKFERLRQQQKEHHNERKKLRRTTVQLKGKLREKEPF